MVEKADLLGDQLETDFVKTYTDTTNGGIPYFEFKIQASENE